MQITVVVVICHTIGAFVPESVGTLPSPVCREDRHQGRNADHSQPALADWKERSIYRGEQWRISRIKCVPGDYVPKERV
jgi:hypothetical protein